MTVATILCLGEADLRTLVNLHLLLDLTLVVLTINNIMTQMRTMVQG